MVVGVCGISLLMKGTIYGDKKATSVSIIGGSDGPTSIFLAGKIGGKEAKEAKEKETEFPKNWAEAFCARDVDYLIDKMSEATKKSMIESGLLDISGAATSFGWSSAWPMFLEKGYRIQNKTEDKATIYYYATTSEPHVYVWKEEIEYELRTGDDYTILEEKIEFFDAISSGKDYEKAYPNGILNNTQMDYKTNGLGELLNQQTIEFGDPISSSKSLLNLLDDEEKVQIAIIEETKTEATLEIHFTKDDANVVIYMRKPYGEEGIWIPQSK